jgi:hypothetical protein
MIRSAFAIHLVCSSACLAAEVQTNAENCTPQPDCKINYPTVQPGATNRVQVLGGNNGIVNDSGKAIQPGAVNPPGGLRVCVPWC